MFCAGVWLFLASALSFRWKEEHHFWLKFWGWDPGPGLSALSSPVPREVLCALYMSLWVVRGTVFLVNQSTGKSFP